MMNKHTGGPAFPGKVSNIQFSGMTLRDYFASQAMAALMPIYWEVQDEYADAKSMIKCHAETAYEYADAMLEARK